MSEQSPSRRWRALLLIAAGLLLLSGLAGIDLWAPDEPRYAQVAEELRSAEHGARSLVLLHLNGEPYTQKPPLYFWLASAFGTATGRVTETAARLPSALAGLALVWLTFVFGRRLLGPRPALLGAALLLTTYEFAHLARRAQLDVLLALFETAALLFFWRLDRGLGSRRANLVYMHGALGLAVLTKGPVGFLVPLLVILAYLVWERRLGDLRRCMAPWALALSLGPGIVWLAASTWAAPAGYLGEAVGVNLFGRFFAGTSHERPFYYYLYQFPLDFLPWTLFWPALFWAARERLGARTSAAGAGATAAAGSSSAGEAAPAWRFLLAWITASLVFFSLSSGKRGLYLLPAFPATALLCADAMLHLVAGRARLPRVISWGAAVGAVLLFGIGVAAAVIARKDLVGVTPSYLVGFSGATLGVVVAASLAWLLCQRRGATPALRLGVIAATAFGVELAIFLLLYPGLDPGKSLRPIARAAAALTEPDGRIGLLGDRAMAGGLVYYGDRRVAPLKTPESVQSFVDGGGRAIVLKERKLPRITAVAPVEVRARFRAGRRTLLVVSPHPRRKATPAVSSGPADSGPGSPVATRAEPVAGVDPSDP